MPFSYINCDCSPLVVDNEYEIINEDLLAQYVGKIVLGHHSHVKRIIQTLSTKSPLASTIDIDLAIAAIAKGTKTLKEIEKRDGWIFQIISWLALLNANKQDNFYCQPPHDAPAQHGLDGVAVVLTDKLEIQNIIITEDKCTENHRTIIPTIWHEFEEFENGLHNNKLVSRVSAMLENLDNGKILESNQNMIYSKDRWVYRVGINRNNTYQPIKGRKGLFKGYDGCVKGNSPHRRYASTILKDDIRSWMEQFSQKVVKFLEDQKANV